MPTDKEILHWLGIAQSLRGNVRARLVEMMDEAFDPEDAETLAGLVMARLGPAAPLPDPTSPYRFVELNTVVISAPEAVREPHLDLPLAGGFSGEISVDWVVETPLLIGKEQGAGQHAEVVPLTLGAPDKFAIPGATLKGLLRAGVEIVTLGRLSQLNRDHRFGLRDFDDKKYRDDEKGQSRLAWDKIGAGWLEWHEASPDEKAKGLSDYCITPCDKRTVRIRALPKSWFSGTPGDGKRHFDWLNKELKDKYIKSGMHGGTPPRKYDFSSGRAHWFTLSGASEAVPADAGVGTQGIYVFSGRLQVSSQTKTESDVIAELDLQAGKSGEKQRKKREYVFFDQPGVLPERVPQAVFDTFELINSTPSGKGLIPVGSWKELRPVVVDDKRRIPVFILGDLAHPPYDFGLTRSFKVAHDRSVGDVLDDQTSKAHVVNLGMTPDWAEALFGNVIEDDDPKTGAARPPSDLARKGRVAVGFAYSTTPAVLFPPMGRDPISTTMMGPRASFAPHYLVGPVKHWSDTQAGLAGRKRYFPRFSGGTPEAAQEIVVADYTLPPAHGGETVSRLRFLAPEPGQSTIGFTGAIRVHNLLAEEVGALLWVLTHGGDIGGPLRHMIGRAKAFGAGQTRVADVRLNKLLGHDPIADTKLGDADKLQPFLDAFEKAMDVAVREARLPGRWAEQAQVREWLGLSNPAWGTTERERKHARYPGAQPDTLASGMNMADGPKTHMDLRKKLNDSPTSPPRWLPTPRLAPKTR